MDADKIDELYEKFRDGFIEKAEQDGTMSSYNANDPEVLNRKDIYMCEDCSSIVMASVWHTVNPDPHGERGTLYYIGKLSVGEQMDLFNYEFRLTESQGANFFLIRNGIEEEGRDCVNKSKWMNKDRPVPSMLFPTDVVSIATDVTARPMFPDEINDWVVAFRKFRGFPLKDHELFQGHLTLREMLMFCMFYEQRYLGFTMQVLCGPIKEGYKYSYKDDPTPKVATEELLFDVAKKEAIQFFGVKEEKFNELLTGVFKGWSYE